MSFGVNPERFLEVRGVGEKRPVIVNGIEDKAASRRVEVYFVQTEEGQG
jgi:outer membrane protein OmpA-like peptidoglycan-associated protein